MHKGVLDHIQRQLRRLMRVWLLRTAALLAAIESTISFDVASARATDARFNEH